MKTKFTRRLCSLILVFMIVLSFSINTFAYDNYNDYNILSQVYYNQAKNSGVYLIENILIGGELFTFTHIEKSNGRIIKISGALNETLNFDEIDQTQMNYNNNDILSDEWYYFPETEDLRSFAVNATRAIVAAGLAGAVGGPVGAFLSIAAAILAFVAGVQFTCRVVNNGRYRVEGNKVRFEYTTDVYVMDRVYTTTWSGYR